MSFAYRMFATRSQPAVPRPGDDEPSGHNQATLICNPFGISPVAPPHPYCPQAHVHSVSGHNPTRRHERCALELVDHLWRVDSGVSSRIGWAVSNTSVGHNQKAWICKLLGI